MKQLTYIYLSETELAKLKKTASKYRVSLSTLADVIIFETYKALKHGKKTTNEELEKNYFIKSPFIKKTSIKPKCFKEKEVMYGLIKNRSIYTSNALTIYANGRIEDYIEKGKDDYYNNINNKLNAIKEQYWDYNNFIRCQRRNLKDNKEYYKRAIEQMEQKQ